MEKIPPIILASSSPRRSEILEMLGIEYIIFKPELDESDPPGDPASMVRYLSGKKAEAALPSVSAELILSADTVVVLDDQVMGKPSSDKEAHDMLGKLSGKWHKVFTGVTILEPGSGRVLTGEEVTAVKFKDLDEKEIVDYIDTGEPFDKAGAYGIQGRGSVLVERIDGCYYNVVGLPVSKVIALLKELGYRYCYPGLYRTG
jgi:septum formation protein